MTLVGLPDFDRPLGAGQPLAWRAFGRDEWLVAAGDVALALRHGNAPDLHVGLYRSFSPARGPAPFGTLDATFRALYPVEAALEAARAVDPQAQVLRALPAGGTVAIRSLTGDGGDEEEEGDELIAAETLRPLAADRLRLSLRLAPEGASLFAAAIESGQMPLRAELVLRYEGVAPRLPLTAVFDPRAVLEALAVRTGNDAIAHASLAPLLENILPDLPIELVGIESGEDRSRLSAALADRLALRFGGLADSADGMLRFAAPGSIAIARFSVDLSQPVRSLRWVALANDPFDVLRGPGAGGQGRLVSRVEVPPILTGAHRVEMQANLPLPLTGVERIGVVLRAPANPPARPHPISTSLLFEEGLTAQHCDIALAPGEDFALFAQGFAILSDNSGMRRVEGPARPVPAAGALFLAPEDFGFAAHRVTATEAALELADLEVTASFLSAGLPVRVTKRLDPGTPALDLAVPLDATQRSLHILATQGAGERRIDLGERALRDIVIDVGALPGFGMHEVRLSCLLPEGAAPVAIDIMSQERRLDADAMQTLVFTSAQGERVWRYFTGNPFAAGFRWRYHTTAPITGGSWHDAPPTARITIDPPPAAETGAASTAEMASAGKTVSLAVDFGNGARKLYRDVPVPETASLHHVLGAAASWRPPLACEVVHLFTDRGGTQRNVLGAVDGVAGPLRGDGTWQVALDGKPCDLNLPGPWSPGRSTAAEPVPPGASIELTLPPG
jgi:hypothetical protein